MATIVTRAGKGSPLTHNEVDANFNNLNNDKVEESTTITAGTGLTGGGDLSANRTISLANTAVAAGSYGSASAVGTFTVDAQGRLTAASNTNIAIANTAVSGLGTMSTQNANNVAITGGSINGTTVGASTASTGAFTTLSASSGATISGGNLAFTTTAQRITGDFSNATAANRLAFQSSTTNGNTNIEVLPNGTGTVSGLILESGSDFNSCSNTQLLVINGSDSRITAGIRGTGSYLPMTFYTNGSERVRIDTSGRFGINLTPSTATDAKLQVTGGTTNATSLATAYSAATVAIVPKSTSGYSVAFASGTSDFPLLQVSANGAAAGDFLLQPYGGNVGIGTASPGTKLTVSSGTNAGISVTDGTVTTIIYNSTGGVASIGTTSNHAINFYSNNTARVQLTNGGELICGGTTDQGAYNLQCNGTGVWGAGAYVNGSDERLKDDITTLKDGLNVISQLRPVTFKYKPDYSKDQNVQTGFIAQELQTALEGKDYLDGIVQAGPNHLNVAYQSLIPILVKAIQELTARVAELEAK